MIAITAIIKSKTEFRNQIFEMVTELVTATRTEKACKRYDLHYDKNTFVIWEEWENQEGLDLHSASKHLQNFIKQSADLLDGELEVYKTLEAF